MSAAAGLLERQPERHPRAILIAVVIFAALSTLCGWWGDGYLEADAATHYLYARRALHEPVLFLDVWGRPVCTGLYAIPAALGGLHAVRFTSLLLALGMAEMVRRIAVGQGRDPAGIPAGALFRWPALAFIFTLAQPLVFLHSFSELTELPFAFLLAGAFLAYQRRRFAVMAILAGLLPAARPEGFGFGLLAAAALVMHGRWLALPLLALPLRAWNFLGWYKWESPDYSAVTLGPLAIGRYLPHKLHWMLWLKANWPYSGNSTYKPGSIFQFAALLPTVTSPLIFPAVLVGIGAGVGRLISPLPVPTKSGRPGEGSVALGNAGEGASGVAVARPGNDAHLRRCAILILILPLAVLLIHSLLFRLGKMASSGEARYLLSVAPFWALLATAGWQWLFDHLRLRYPFALATVAALLPMSVNYWWEVIPLQNTPDWHAAARLVEWHAASDLRRRYPTLLAQHPAVALAMADRSPSTRPLAVTRGSVSDAPPGTILLWDPIYSGFNADANAVVLPQDLMAAGWVLVSDGAVPHESDWYIFLSPKTADGQPTPFDDRSGDFLVPRGRLDPIILKNHAWRQYRAASSNPSTPSVTPSSSAPASSPSR